MSCRTGAVSSALCWPWGSPSPTPCHIQRAPPSPVIPSQYSWGTGEVWVQLGGDFAVIYLWLPAICQVLSGGKAFIGRTVGFPSCQRQMVPAIYFCSCLWHPFRFCCLSVQCGEALPTSQGSSEPAFHPLFIAAMLRHTQLSLISLKHPLLPLSLPKGKTKCLPVMVLPWSLYICLSQRHLHLPTSVDQWFSKQSPWTSITTIITQESVRNLGAHPRRPDPDIQGVAPGICH